MGATGDAAVRHAVDVAENCLGAVDRPVPDPDLGLKGTSTSEKLGGSELDSGEGTHMRSPMNYNGEKARDSGLKRAKERLCFTHTLIASGFEPTFSLGELLLDFRRRFGFIHLGFTNHKRKKALVRGLSPPSWGRPSCSDDG